MDVEARLDRLFSNIDIAFKAFANEMRVMKVWNNVTVIQSSDFARTLNPNGGDGTDHAWGGNYMTMGECCIIKNLLLNKLLKLDGANSAATYLLLSL